ncbi:MAG: DUF2318 domain-containing protein [Lachnospiraceae bacterium]|nr:DUF2318 domain-containing protein [Lachnospiraceae bacterium]
MAKENANGTKKSGVLWIVAAAVVVVVAVIVTVFPKGKAGSATNGAETLSAGENLVIQTADVTETASFYPVNIDGTEMEVLAIRDSEGKIRTAFNTCQSCYTSGNGRYAAEGNELICQNCGFHFSADEVGIETGGGCNPWPITEGDKIVTEDTIEISYEFLAASKNIFANWGSH